MKDNNGKGLPYTAHKATVLYGEKNKTKAMEIAREQGKKAIAVKDGVPVVDAGLPAFLKPQAW